MAAPADSPISAARVNADAELKKALSVIDPLDFSSNVAAFDAFIHATKLLFNEEVFERLHTCIDSRTFKGEVARLHEQIVDEYTKAPAGRIMTKRERLLFERPTPLDEKPSFVPTDKWDLFALTILLPNKKHFVRKALRHVLGDQLRYWLSEADRRCWPVAEAVATEIRDGGEIGMSQTATFNRCPVTVVRDEGTPLERRWETSMSGDFATPAIFDDGVQRVRTGDLIYCSLFSEPHVITRVEPELVGMSPSGSNVAYWKAKIMPRCEWVRLEGDNQLRRFGEFNPPVLGGLLPRQEYPKHLYHETDEPVVVYNASEEAAARAHGYGDAYVHKEYPKYKYHWTKEPVVVQNADEEAALGGGWADGPTEFAPYRLARSIKTDHEDPIKWVDEWPVTGLSTEQRNKIKAQLLKADSAFWRAPDAESADLNAMKLAFDGIARVLFEAGILTEQLLRSDLLTLLWDSAIAAGWYRFASEAPASIFPDQIGHYHVWRDEAKDWRVPFRAETAQWLAALIEVREATSGRQEPKTSGKRKADAGLQNLRTRVRKFHDDGLTHREICDRLANSPRPPRAGWRDLEWPTAYKRHTPAVTKWLSDASK